MKSEDTPRSAIRQGAELHARSVVGLCVKHAISLFLGWSLLASVPALLPSAEAQADAGVDEAAQRFRELVNADPFAHDPPIGETPDPLATDANSSLTDAEMPGEDEVITERFPVVHGEIVEAIAGVREREHRVSIELTSGLALIRHELTFESAATHAAEVRYRLAIPQGAIPYALEVCSEAQGCRAGQLSDPATRFSDYDTAVLARGPYDATQAPVAAVDRSEDGASLLIRASAIAALATNAEGVRAPASLVVRVAYSLPLEARGSRVRFSLPSRGTDVRAATAEVRIHAEDWVLPRIDGVEIESSASVTQRPNQALSLDATVPRTWTTHADAWTTPCRVAPWSLRSRAEHCTWVRAMSSRSTVDAANVVLALDVSPSMRAGASGLVSSTAMAVLAQLPEHARVRVVAFAARSERVIAEGVSPASITEESLQRAMELPLGSATRFEALFASIEPWLGERDLRVVWIGDGGLTQSESALSLAARTHASRASFELVSVASRPATRSLQRLNEVLGGHWISAHAEALLGAQSAEGRAALQELLAASLVTSPAQRLVVSNAEPRALLPGASVAFATHAASVSTVQLNGALVRPARASGDLALAIAARVADAHRLVAAPTAAPLVCSSEGSPVRTAGARVTRLLTHFGPAERRSCGAPQVTPAIVETRAGFPSRALHRSLLRSVLPQLRECFRADRRGRAAYATRAQLTLLIADQEVQDVRVEGAFSESRQPREQPISDALRTCMITAIDALDVPAFDGAILARWPVFTEASTPPPRIELRPDLSATIDELAPQVAIPNRPEDVASH